MDEAVKMSLETDRVIDITTTGRKTGMARRKEIWFQNFDGNLYIMGSPGPHDWHANVISNPQFTFHLKRSVKADLPAMARAIFEKGERREVLGKIHQRLTGEGMNGLPLEDWVARSPLIQVEILDS